MVKLPERYPEPGLCWKLEGPADKVPTEGDKCMFYDKNMLNLTKKKCHKIGILPDYVCMAHHQLVRLSLLLRFCAVKILPEKQFCFSHLCTVVIYHGTIDFTDMSLYT